MPDETNTPVAQVIRNYTANLPVFPPADPDLLRLHAGMAAFYRGFIPAAEVCGIAESEQGKVLERAQKTLWTFGRAGRLEQGEPGPALVLEQQPALENLKFPRPEVTFALLGRLGIPQHAMLQHGMLVEYRAGEGWSGEGKLKGCAALRLRWDLAPALQELAARAAASSPKEKAVYARFLRVNPQAVLAREKPPLDLPPDAPAILANLPAPAAAAWQALVRCLAGFEGFAPMVEFRSIHHGMWTVNYEAGRGGHSGRDLCGLIVQNGEMTVRIILYRAGHLYVKERLESFGAVVADAFHRAHYYEEFEHQWLFIPVRGVGDLEGVERLLKVMPGLLKS